MKKVYLKKDRSIALELYGYKHSSDPSKGDREDLLNGWVRVLKNGRSVAICINFDAAIAYINKHLLQEKDVITEQDFEGF